MSRDRAPTPRAPRIVVRETDDYVSHRHEDETPPEPPNRWIRTLFQPALTTLMVACVVWSVAVFTASLPAPTAEGAGVLARRGLVFGAGVLMAFVGFQTQRVVQRRFLSGSDSTRFKLVELAVMFLVVKALHHFSDTVPAFLEAVATWTRNPMSFFDAESVIAYLVGLGAWLAAGLTARDLDAVTDPTRYLGETGPRERLISRYFLGGGILLVFTALNRIPLTSLATLTQGRVRGLIWNALLYFLLGLLMMGQINWARFVGLWQREKVTVSEGLGGAWLRYTLLFVALAALIAFLLPTGYTVGILDLVRMIMVVISYIATMIYLLILWPIGVLMSLLQGNSPEGGAQAPEPPPLPPPPPVMPEAAGAPWWAVLRSVLFWVVLLGVVVALIRSYLRDRPELLAALKRLGPWRLLRRLWQGLRHWLRSASRHVQVAVPKLVARLRRPRRRGKAGAARTRGSGPRDRVIYTYLITLDRAQKQGVARRQTETPYEYRVTLAPHLAEHQDAMDSLTEAFVRARYSTHPVTEADVQAQEANADEVRRGLERAQEAGPRTG